ncbi:MAG: CAP domain-containing protein [Ignavibacteriales bacterium]
MAEKYHHLPPTIRVALLLAICLLACASSPATAAAGTAARSPDAGDSPDREESSLVPMVMLSDDRERTLFELVNAERKNMHLPPLNLDERLCNVARRHAEDMIRSRYFGHLSPNSGTLAGRLARAEVTFEKAGENLAGNTSVPDAHRMLMQSPVHRGNILNPDFTRIGAAVVEGGPYGMMIVEVFADECTTLATVTPATTVTPAESVTPDNNSESLMAQ